MFKACLGHMLGYADVTSVYKRNAAHMLFATSVLLFLETTVFYCRMPPQGKGHGKSTDKCQTFYTSTHDIVSAELFSFSGI